MRRKNLQSWKKDHLKFKGNHSKRIVKDQKQLFYQHFCRANGVRGRWNSQRVVFPYTILTKVLFPFQEMDTFIPFQRRERFMKRICFSFGGLGFTFGFPVFTDFPAFPASASLFFAFSLLHPCFSHLLVLRGLAHSAEGDRQGEGQKKRPEVPPMRASRIVRLRFKHSVRPYVFLFWREEERKEAREEKGRLPKLRE